MTGREGRGLGRPASWLQKPDAWASPWCREQRPPPGPTPAWTRLPRQVCVCTAWGGPGRVGGTMHEGEAAGRDPNDHPLNQATGWPVGRTDKRRGSMLAAVSRRAGLQGEQPEGAGVS